MSDSIAAKKRSITSSQFVLNNYLKNTYALRQSRNLDNFLYKIGVAKDTRRKASKLKSTVRLTRKLKNYTLTTSYEDGRVSKITFELGKPVTRELQNGSKVTSLFLVKDNNLEETQCSEERTIVVTRAFGPEFVVVTMIAENERCDRFYKKVQKPDYEDIRSETSRRTFSHSQTSTPTSESFTIDSEIEVLNVI